MEAVALKIPMTLQKRDPDQWYDADYWSINDVMQLGELELPLRRVYRKTPLAG